MKVYNPTNCTFIDRQVVQHQDVREMRVAQQCMGGEGGTQAVEKDDEAGAEALLAAHIRDGEVRRTIADAVQHCRRNGEVAPMVAQILKEHRIGTASVVTKPFCEALARCLPYKTSKQALYQAFYRL